LATPALVSLPARAASLTSSTSLVHWLPRGQHVGGLQLTMADPIAPNNPNASFGSKYRTYKRGSQSIAGQVCGEKCNSLRWYAGSRGANPGCFAVLTSYFAFLCRRAQPSAQPIPCPGIMPMASGEHPVELTALRETLCSLVFTFHLRTRNRPRKHG
jgi:hypothetical protein